MIDLRNGLAELLLSLSSSLSKLDLMMGVRALFLFETMVFLRLRVMGDTLGYSTYVSFYSSSDDNSAEPSDSSSSLQIDVLREVEV